MSVENETEWPEGLEPRQQAFLEMFTRLGSVVAASRGVCARTSHYRWIEQSAVYKKSFAIAQQLFADGLIDQAISRAINGAPELVFHKGVPAVDASGKPVTRTRPDRYLLKLLIARNDQHLIRDIAQQNRTNNTP